jgi:hypothetical protein
LEVLFGICREIGSFQLVISENTNDKRISQNKEWKNFSVVAVFWKYKSQEK